MKKIIWMLMIVLLANIFPNVNAEWLTNKTIIIDNNTTIQINNFFNKRNINKKLKKKKFTIEKIPFMVWNNIIELKSNWDDPYLSFLNYIKANKNDVLLKKYIIHEWNNYSTNYLDILLNYNYNKCTNIYNRFSQISNIKILYSNEINNKGYKFINKFSDKDFWKLIACWYSYIFPKGYKLTTLKTLYIPYRYKNITMVINKNFINVLRPNQVFSTVNKVLRNHEYKFVTWKAIVNWKIKEIEAWGACWISTILYQTLLKHFQEFKIISRRPHSAWYTYLYWKMFWLDSTIYDMWKSSIDLKFMNKWNTNIIFQWYNERIWKYWFKYWIKVFSPYLKNSYVKASKMTKIPTDQIHSYIDKKSWKKVEKKITYKCVNNFIYSSRNNVLLKKNKSCYKFVNEHF